MTLVELLVVLGIVGLILGISVPGLTTYANQTRLNAATRQVIGLLGLARSRAISAHEDHAVLVDAQRRQITVESVVSGTPLEQVVRLPPSINVEVEVAGEPAQESRLVFRPTGSLAGRTTSIILADRKKRSTVTVSGITGAVTVE
ncbi:MAG: GspH/FimT family pseudopilin [Candidatus Omnitrophica bacterium]|nr:GspH/FimT family pseudopilin [Candidatus Omnitrophota bacterium]